jgi:hypothetical protein
VSPQPELEHGHVPADSADAELALAEERSTAPSERATRGAIQCPVAAETLSALEGERGAASLRPGDAVDRTGIEPVGAEPDLESGDARTGREPAGSEHEDADAHRDADDGEATHAPVFAAAGSHPPQQDAGEAG